MTASWKLFRIICVLQMLATVSYALIAVMNFAQTGSFNLFFKSLCFGLMAWLSIFALITLNNNYPDVPVNGLQKSIFNWLFLFNFLLFAFLFALIIAEYREIRKLASLTSLSFFQVPFSLLWPLVIYVLIFLFQMAILYGLYNLRTTLYMNFMRKKFEFEKENL